MRLRFIEITNFLSFGPKVERINFDDNLTVLIGPNGGGKTNAFRAIRLVDMIIRSVASNDNQARCTEIEEFGQPHFGHLHEPSEIRLGISFTSAHEKEIIRLFLRAAIASTLLGVDPVGAPRVEHYGDLLERLDVSLPSDVKFLCDGEVVASHTRTPSSLWELFYDFNFPAQVPTLCDGVRYRWDLSGRWKNYLHAHVDRVQSNQSVETRIWPDGQLVPSSLGLNNFLLVTGEMSALKIIKFNRQNDALSIYSDIRKAGIDTESAEPKSEQFGFDTIIYQIFRKALVWETVSNEFGTAAIIPTRVLSGEKDGVHYAPYKAIPTYLEDLVRWKVGSLLDRNRFASAQALFTELRGTDEKFDVEIQNHTIATSSPSVTYDQTMEPCLLVTPVVISGDVEIPAYLAGSGAVEHIRLSAQLVAPVESIVLLDEPTARLHPLAQKRLLHKLEEEGGAQHIVITHAPGLLPTQREAFQRTHRITKSATGTKAAYFKTGLSASNKQGFGRMVKELQSYPAIANIPFASAVIFVSGETELLTYPTWYDFYRTSNNTKRGEVQFYNFAGDDKLKTPLAIAMIYGVPWAVLADGNSFRPENITSAATKTPSIAKQLRQAYEWSETAVDTNLSFDLDSSLCSNGRATKEWFGEVASKLRKCGVFTLANCTLVDAKTNERRTCCNTCEAQIELKCRPAACEKWHSETDSHQESFEDFAKNDSDLKHAYEEVRVKRKPERGFLLLEKHPSCPAKLSKLFAQMDEFLFSGECLSADQGTT